MTLEVDGQGFREWESLSVTLSLEAAARSFSGQAFQQYAGQVVARPGSSAVLRVDGALLVTGWVDDIEVLRSKAGSVVTFDGRSRTCDLVDCSPAPTTPKRWTGATAAVIAQAIATPYGITVTPPAAGLEPFPRFALEDGETAWDAIDRLCSARGLLAIDTPTGDLQLVRLSAATLVPHVGVLQGGGNLIEWRCAHKGSQRYSAITARGQSAADASTPAAVAASILGAAADVGVARPRYLTIDAHGLNAASAASKAQWEVATRYGRAITVTCTVPGWTDDAGTVWTPGRSVRVRLPHAGLDTDLVVAEVTLQRSVDGSTSTLLLHPVEAFATYMPTPTARRGSRGYEAGLIDVKKAVATAEAYR